MAPDSINPSKRGEAIKETVRHCQELGLLYAVPIITDASEWANSCERLPELDPRLKPGFGYVRFSSIMQAESFSLEAQIRQIIENAARDGVQIRAIFADPLQSAFHKRLRPGIQAMLRALLSRNFQVGYVHKVDRLARKLEWALEIVGEMQKNGVKLKAVEQKFDVDTADGWLLFQFLGSLGEFYSNNLSKETVKGKLESSANGYHNGCPPWGYVSELKGKRRVGIPDPRLVPIIVQAFEMYATGIHSDQHIAEWLNSLGHRNARGAPFTQYNIREMLQNPYYAGWVRYKGLAVRPRNTCYRSTPAKLSLGLHQAVIGQELFDRCQSVRVQRRKRKGIGQPTRHVYLLNGIITCSHCGRGLRAQTCRKPYYREVSHHVGSECPAKRFSVAADLIDEQVAILIQSLKLPPDWETLVRELMEKSAPDSDPDAEKRRLREQLRRVRNAYIQGLYDDDDYLYRRETETLKERLAMLERTPASAIHRAAQTLLGIRESWGYATQEERRDLVQIILQEVCCDILGKQVVWVKPRTGFETLFHLTPDLGGFIDGNFYPTWAKVFPPSSDSAYGT